jgi:hypothetical protein
MISLLRQSTLALVERHWFLIMALASELERSKEMDKVAMEPLYEPGSGRVRRYSLLSAVVTSRGKPLLYQS